MSKKLINATRYDYLPTYPSDAGRARHLVNGVIETPKKSCHKYALQPDFGIIAFHSVLPEKLEWPYDYGFIPQTLAPDGDPLDLLVISEDGLFSACLIEVRVLGAFREKKDRVENDRLVGVPLPSPGAPLPSDSYLDIVDVPKNELDKMQRFLTEYSSLQGHEIQIRAVVGALQAMKTVKGTHKAFRHSKS